MLTIFTPTYNRRELLERAYRSLTEQTRQDFIWLIVDDGSTDGTSEQVQEWIEANQILIRYHVRENGGKMRAHNDGVRLCHTELFLCLDSDDYLGTDAVEQIYLCWSRNQDDHVAGIIAHKGESKDKVLGGASFPACQMSTLRGLYRAGFLGETTLIFRTEILKQHLFPEIPGEKYVPEDYIYDKIDEKYEFIVLDRILTICEIVEEGYTKLAPKLRMENKNGWFLYYEQRAQTEPFSILKMKYICHYIRFAQETDRNIWKEKRISFREILLGIPGALLLRLMGKL